MKKPKNIKENIRKCKKFCKYIFFIWALGFGLESASGSYINSYSWSND